LDQQQPVVIPMRPELDQQQRDQNPRRQVQIRLLLVLTPELLATVRLPRVKAQQQVLAIRLLLARMRQRLESARLRRA
jgi:hypothetical protein